MISTNDRRAAAAPAGVATLALLAAARPVLVRSGPRHAQAHRRHDGRALPRAGHASARPRSTCRRCRRWARGLDRAAVRDAREPDARRPRRQPVRAQVYLNMANGPDQLRQRAMFAPEPDHRRLGQQGHRRRRADPVGAAALAQRLRQLPHAAARRLAQPDDGQVPRQRLQPQGDRRRPRPTRTTPASCCSSSRSACGS